MKSPVHPAAPVGNSPFGSAVGLLPGLVFTPDMEAAALVCHQLSVGLHHDRVEVLDRVVLLRTATRDVRNSYDFNYAHLFVIGYRSCSQ